MISKGDYWREITALNERAAKAEYALAYAQYHCRAAVGSHVIGRPPISIDPVTCAHS